MGDMSVMRKSMTELEDMSNIWRSHVEEKYLIETELNNMGQSTKELEEMGNTHAFDANWFMIYDPCWQ